MEKFSPKDYQLTPHEACKLLKVSLNTLRVWRRKGQGPKPLRIGKKIWYSEKAIEDYLKACWDRTYEVFDA